MKSRNARLIALYLPQYHPVPQNDEWWGAGFTEWTNVAKAKPLFSGHVQPHLPADLGFYDLRVPESRIQQADLARSAGIEGFCYWHYWFGNGVRILERPFEEVMASSSPDFPFALAWANQSWTGVWHGNPRSVLMKQEYPGKEDEAQHFNWALTAFNDRRYLRVDGKPIFVVYAPHDLPSTTEFIRHWRLLAERAGLPGIFFIAISNRYEPGVDAYYGAVLSPFDAVTRLTPQDYLEGRYQQVRRRLDARVWARDFGRLAKAVPPRLRGPLQVHYRDVVAHAFEDLPRSSRFLPSVLPNWDNTPRSGRRGVVFKGSTPELFAKYLEKAVAIVESRPEGEAIVFIKAWNEWAEGNYLEPDSLFGHGYLNAVRQVMRVQT